MSSAFQMVSDTHTVAESGETELFLQMRRERDILVAKLWETRSYDKSPGQIRAAVIQARITEKENEILERFCPIRVGEVLRRRADSPRRGARVIVVELKYTMVNHATDRWWQALAGGCDRWGNLVKGARNYFIHCWNLQYYAREPERSIGRNSQGKLGFPW